MSRYKLTPSQIENWVSKHFDYKARRGGEELLICNPFVIGDEGFKFNISTQLVENKYGTKGYWVHDWRPSASEHNGSFIKFVQSYKGLSFIEAIKDVCGDGIDLHSITRPTSTEPKYEEPIEHQIELPDSALPIQDNKYGKIQTIAINYLKSRGISLTQAKSFQIHYTATMIIFPYFEYGSIVYWQGRTFSRYNKQFEFPPRTEKSRFIYGFDNAEPYQPVSVTEAIYDALTIGPGSLATGGASLMEMQVRKIKAINPSVVILAPDNDYEGIVSIYKNYQLLRSKYPVNYVLPPEPFKDWNEMACSYSDKQKGITEVRLHINNNQAKITRAASIKLRKLAKDKSPKKSNYLM